MYLIVVDSHSKWPEIIYMKHTTSLATITALRSLIARYGMPVQLVADNEPQFTSEEFKTFTKKNGILDLLSAPYHPATNGLAVRFIQSLKNSLKAMHKGHKVTHQHLIDMFLFQYRTTTNEIPAKLFLGRELRTRLDLVKPNQEHTVANRQAFQLQHHKGKRTTTFKEGDIVNYRNYQGEKK